ncbi:fibronectin-binding protein RevA [Borreliella carolinensis]|uniref:Fibronectin-binding protein RevA n=1 Tax=Borreliella carolinensis TaxID=478174 RepID=A0ACD5GKW1_9SPIR
MKKKNIFKLFFVLMLFVMACKADVGEKNQYAEEENQINLLMSGVSTLNEKTNHKKFNEYKDKINQLKEKFKDINDAKLQEKLLALEKLFNDKLAAKLAALKAAKEKIDGFDNKENNKENIWSEAKLVGVTVKFHGTNAAGKGAEMSKEAVEQIEKIIKFLEEGTN